MARRRSQAPIGASLIVLSSFFYASYGVWTKLMGNFFGGYTASALRSVLVVIILLPIALLYRQLEPIKWRVNWKYILGFLVSALFIWGPLYYAILHAGVGLALAVNYASIVIGSFFFGALLAGEKFTRDKLLSATLGIVGLLLVFAPSINSFGGIGLLAAALSGLAGAANLVMAKQIRYGATQATLTAWITSIVANVLMAYIFNETYPRLGLQVEWFYLVVFAIASIAASWLAVKGVKLIDAGVAGILGLVEIVFGVMIGYVFFGERFGVIVLLGMSIIIIAASVPYTKEYLKQRT